MPLNAIKNRLDVRAAEVDLIRRFLSPECKVLEIGGGSGWQAKQIASWGLEVKAIDVDQQADPYHSVELYDGVNIPFPVASFDFIFSSNVLEHVEMRAKLFTDMKRVLKHGGYMIHIVPSASWRLWTALTHYPYLVKRIVQTAFPVKPLDITDAHVHHEVQRSPGGNIFHKLRKSIWPVPHGIDGCVFKELITFSRWGWRACFRDAELNILDEYRNGIFYTGYRLLPWLGLGSRRFLASFLGSSCHVFVLRVPSALDP
jgi:SAM-dependent methyltransferase